ncbi:hypothetical protein LINPERHAP1_LOCUS17818, partial [Linum perenne]
PRENQKKKSPQTRSSPACSSHPITLCLPSARYLVNQRSYSSARITAVGEDSGGRQRFSLPLPQELRFYGSCVRYIIPYLNLILVFFH